MDNGFESLAEYVPEVTQEVHEQPAFIQLQQTFPALADEEHQQAFLAYVETMWAAPGSYMDLYRAYMEFLTPSEKALKFKRLADYIKQNPGRSSSNSRGGRGRRRTRKPRSRSQSDTAKDEVSARSSSNTKRRESNKSDNNRGKGSSENARPGNDRTGTNRGRNRSRRRRPRSDQNSQNQQQSNDSN